MTRVKAVYRSWAIPCAGKQVYGQRHRLEWLGKIQEAGVRRRAEVLPYAVGRFALAPPGSAARAILESRQHGASKLLSQIPSIGPIRAALLIALLQTPDRFRTKRQLWAYSGLAIETHDSAESQYVNGQLHRSMKKATIRGLNQNHNHDLKNLFKSASSVAAAMRQGRSRSFRCSDRQRIKAGDGAADSGTQDCSDHPDRLEEGAPATPLGWSLVRNSTDRTR